MMTQITLKMKTDFLFQIPYTQVKKGVVEDPVMFIQLLKALRDAPRARHDVIAKAKKLKSDKEFRRAIDTDRKVFKGIKHETFGLETVHEYLDRISHHQVLRRAR